MKQLYHYLQNGAPYLENFIPTDLDSKANFGGVQLMFAGKATPPRLRSHGGRHGPDPHDRSRPDRQLQEVGGTAVAEPGNRRTGAARRGRSRRRPWQALVWIAPALVAIAFVYGYSIYRLVLEATHRDGKSVGLGNLRIALDDPFFRTALGNNLRLLLTLPVIIAIALTIAILLHEGMRGWRVHRVAIFIPYMLPVTVVGVLFGELLTLHGAVNSTLQSLHLGP